MDLKSVIPEWVSAGARPARVTVLDPAWSSARLREELTGLAARAGRGVMSIGFVNLGGGAALISQLLGGRPEGWSEEEVREALLAAGLQIRSRTGAHAPGSALAGDTTNALRQLFSQLNEGAAHDWVVLEVAAEAVVSEPVAYETGLLSVVIRNHSISRLAALDEAIFSLATQAHRQLEIILVTQSTEQGAVAQLEEVLARHQAVGGYTYRVVHVPSRKDIRAKLVNVGFEAGRGQYIAVLDDDDVVYPHHYSRMIGEIQRSDRAWAVSPVRRMYMTRDGNGELYCVNRNLMPMAGEFDWAKLINDNYITCHAWVVDRRRVGHHKVQFEERLAKSEDYVMLVRMAALFRPVVITGVPSAEYRIRDDGTNTILNTGLRAKEMERIRREWDVAMALKDQITYGVQMLTTRGELLRNFSKLPEFAPALQQTWRPDELRYRLADRANSMLKERVPAVHKRIKAALAKITPETK